MAANTAREGEKLIATNPSAHSNYFIDEIVEAGIALTGTEVKSLRQTSPNLREGYIEVSSRARGVEAWLVNVHIGPYSHGNIWNHEVMRRRRLLLHRRQIEHLFGAVTQKGYTLVPTRMYFMKGLAKIEIGLGKGKKKGDKRETERRKTAENEMKQAIRERNQRTK